MDQYINAVQVMAKLFLDVTAGPAGFNVIAICTWLFIAMFTLGAILKLTERG